MLRTEYREDKWIFPFVKYENCSKNGGNLPLILQLHGAGERGEGKDDLKFVDVHGISKIADKISEECIIVMPQCPQDTFWAARVESIIKFIAQLKAEFNIDEDRVYITGLSMGGYGTWFTAMAKPDLFAAIVPVCGGGMAWNVGVLNMPVWAFHGDCDGVVSTYQTDEMVAALKTAGADVTYTRLEGVGHNAWDYAYTPELISWMLSKKRHG